MKPRFEWRHQYDMDRDKKEGDLAMLVCKDESLTQQQFTEDADLNVIAKRFGLESIPTVPLNPALFRDTTEDPDLREILENNRMARDNFMMMPAKLRKRFHNSPKEFWDFLNDPENLEEAVRLGILQQETPATAGAAAPAPTPSTSSGTPGSTGPANTENPPKAPASEGPRK